MSYKESLSEPQLQNTDVGPLLSYEASATTSAAEHQTSNHQNLHEHQKENENNPTYLKNSYRQTCLTKGGCDGFKQTSGNLVVF